MICAGAAPGLTDLLAKRGAELLGTCDSIHIRLYESTESKDPVSMWSAEVAYDEATSRPRIYRDGKFALARRFGDREKFRFPPPVGEAAVYLAAQDEVCLLPLAVAVKNIDAKIGGNDFDRLKRWYKQGRLRRSQGIVRKRFPQTPTPRHVAGLIRKGKLENARFLAAVVVRGEKDEQPLQVRWDVTFPTLYQIRRHGMITTPVSYATANVAAMFIRHFPRDEAGVFVPAGLPAEIRRGILADARGRDFRITLKITKRKKRQEEHLD